MAQNNPISFPIDPFTTSGIELATRLNELFEAYKTTESGISRPTYGTQGYQWLDTTSNINILKFYTGSADLNILEFDVTANKAIVNGGVGIADKSKSILFKYSATASEIPTPADMVKGEMILNIADNKIYSLDDNDVVQEFGGGGDFLLLAGGTVTGAVKGIAPVANEDFTRKDYVDTALGLKANIADVYLKTQTYSQTETDTLLNSKIGAGDYATNAVGGTLKARLDGSTLYLTNDGSNA